MATAVAVVTIASTLYSVSEQKKQRRQQKKARRAEQKRAEAENFVARQQAVADRLRAAAAARAAGAASGLGAGATSVQAEESSLGAQLGANLGFANQIQALEAERAKAMEKIAASQARVGNVAAAANLINAGISTQQSFKKPTT